MTGGPPSRRGVGFWLSAAAGWAVIGIGLQGIVAHSADTRPADLARFVLGGALAHDLAVAPIVLAVGVGLTRTVPAPARATLQAALAISAVTALYAYPLVRGYGRALGNPTSLPHDYAANLTMVLAVVWAVAAGALLVGLGRPSRRGRRRRTPTSPP